jgi:ribonuclease VapC
MFVDASAIVAILADEPERMTLRDKVDRSDSVLVSPLSIYEATTALMRIGRCSLRVARALADRFAADTAATLIVIDAEIGAAALEAFDRFGKGRHRAALNFGDCFSYACAKVHRVPLLCKGGDFKLTDVKLA